MSYSIVLSGRSAILTLKAQVAVYKKAVKETTIIATDAATNAAAEVG